MPNSDDTTIPFDRFVAVLGWDEFSHAITNQLLASSNRVAVITDSEDEQVDIEEEFDDEDLRVYVMHLADYSRMKQIGLGRAHSLFVNMASDEENLTTILRLKNDTSFPDLDYMVALTDEKLERTFRSAGVTYAISKFNISSKILASFLYEPDVAAFEEDLLTATETKEDYDIQQYAVKPGSEAAGMTFIELMRTARSAFQCVPIGLKKAATGELIKVPSPGIQVEAHDYVLLVLQGSSEAKVENFFGVKEGVLNGSA